MRSLVPTLQSVLLATTASLHSASASVGVVDIDSLLHTKDQHPIVPASAHYDAPTPWSHPPHCVRSTSLSSAGKRFCVYSSNMTGPTGISLILTPKTAVAAQHHIDDSPLTNFLTDAQAEALYLNDPPYKVVDMQEKGMGVVAARRIEMYETIMVDQAAVVEDVDVEGAVEDGLARKLLARAVRQLRRPVIVRDLSAKHAGYQPGVEAEGEDEGRLEEDVMLTNAFGSAIAGTKCRALYPLVSRINHACNPNAYVLFSRAGISMAVKASRPIEPGEEITISYVTLGQPFPRRQDALKRWGFTCTCPLCSLPPMSKTESDVRRTLIAQAGPKTLELWREGNYADAIAIAEETIGMILEEEQGHMLPDQYALLAKLWLVAGERDKAENYARRSFDLLAKMGFLGREGEAERESFELESFLEMVGQGIGNGES